MRWVIYENNCWMKSCTGQNVLLNNQPSTKPAVDYMSCRRINRTLSLQSFGIVWQIKWKLEVHFPLCGVMKELIDSCATLRKRAREQRKEGKEPDLISDALLVKDKGGKKDINRNVGRWCNNINSNFNITRLSKTTFSLNSPLTQLQEFQELE